MQTTTKEKRLTPFVVEELEHKYAIACDELKGLDADEWVETAAALKRVLENPTAETLHAEPLAVEELENAMDILQANYESEASGVIPEIYGDPKASRELWERREANLREMRKPINQLKAALRPPKRKP